MSIRKFMSTLANNKKPPARLQTIDEAIVAAENFLEGWCSREKATALADIVVQERPSTCLEIGVFGGRSIVPCAAALRQNGSGVIYGVETWSPNVATEHVTNEVNDQWWRNVDFPRIKRDFYAFISRYGFTDQIKVVEAPSRDAAGLFGRLDFLHVDGGHSVINAAEDVVLYSRKVKVGGIIVLDDANWETTQPAYAILKSICEPVRVINDEHGQPACAFMRKVRD
jgi:predicted O-methyltransferase YrrM